MPISKTVLITGSSKGLGESLALIFSENKYNIILHGRDEKGLQRVKAAILKNDVRCDVVRGDITSEKIGEEMAHLAEERNLDIVINNAGVYFNGPCLETPFEDFRRLIEINLLAPVRLTQRILPIFQRKKSGLIVNINSVAGKNPSAGESAYCASKHGLRGFSRSLQHEATKYSVRILDVYLGVMHTQMVSSRPEPEKFIETKDAALAIFQSCREYPSLRVTEINLSRRIY